MNWRETPGELGRTELQNACFLHTPLRRLVVKSVPTGLLLHYYMYLQKLGGGRVCLPAFPFFFRKKRYRKVAGGHSTQAHYLNSSSMEKFSWKVKHPVCIGSVSHLASSRGLVALLNCMRLAFPCYVLYSSRK